MPERITLAPYIWHREPCPAPSLAGECSCGYAAAKALAERIDGQRKEPATERASHEWIGCRRGGDPTDAGSVEYVRYCEVCGMEDTCEDPLPACPGTTAEKRDGITPDVMDEIEERAKAATDGLIESAAGSVVDWKSGTFTAEWIANRDYPNKGADGKFFAAARTDVLDLVACVRNLTVERDELKESNASLLRRLDAALSASRDNYAAAVREREEIRGKLDFILREWKAENDRLRAERDAEGEG